MANWTTATQASTFDADTYMNKAQAARKYSINSGAVGGLDGGQINVLGFKMGYDVVGINASKIKSELIPAIEDYIKKINTEIGAMNVTVQKMRAAFRGADLEKAVSRYAVNMEKFLKDFTSQLRSFEDKLMDVSKAWEKSQSAQAASINKTGSSFSNVSEYKRQVS